MQIRDLIQELQRYPEDWPIMWKGHRKYLHPTLKIVNAPVDPCEGYPDEVDQYVSRPTRQFLAIAYQPEVTINPKYPRYKYEPPIEPAVGQIWKRRIEGDHEPFDRVRLNIEYACDGRARYYGIWDIPKCESEITGVLRQTARYDSLQDLIEYFDLTYDKEANANT